MANTVWKSLEYWFRTPVMGLPTDVVEIAEAYIPQWESLRADERDAAAKVVDKGRAESLQRNWAAAEAEAGNPDVGFCGWLDYSMHAAHWFDMAAVSPRDAASLLCHADPLDESSDPDRATTGETSPDDFKLLLLVFLDAEGASASNRTLVEWYEISKSRRCKCHSWVGQYLAARERLGMIVTRPSAAVVPETTEQRCKRLLEWFEEEKDHQEYGALARVVKRDGRARQTVTADIERARQVRRESSSSISAMAQVVTR